jgi:hypothetical protein
MGAFRIPVTASIAVHEAFADMPPSLKAYVKEGFVVLSRIPASHIPTLANLAVEAVQTPYKTDVEELAKRFELSEDEAGTLLSAISFLTVFVSGRKDKTEDVIAAAVDAKLISEGSRQAALAFGQAVAAQREALRQSLDRSKLATRVLPSLAEFETALDLRFGLAKGRIDLAVPVVIAHLDTDAEGTEMWFQMQKADVEKLVQDLQQLLKELSEVEKWADKRN